MISGWLSGSADLPRRRAEREFSRLAELLLAASLFIVAGQWLIPSEQREASAVVESLHKGLIAVMREDPALDFTTRSNRLRVLTGSFFDLPSICEATLGRYWEALEERQRRQFITLYARLIVVEYASRFDRYTGQRFRYRGERFLHKDRLLVKSELIQGSGEVVELDYLLHRVAGKWYILSVRMHGVSDLSLRRTEYSGIMRKEGFDFLLRRLYEYLQGPGIV